MFFITQTYLIPRRDPWAKTRNPFPIIYICSTKQTWLKVYHLVIFDVLQSLTFGEYCFAMFPHYPIQADILIINIYKSTCRGHVWHFDLLFPNKTLVETETILSELP